MNINVNINKKIELIDFLIEKDFFIESLEDNVYKVSKQDSIDVFMKQVNNTLFFEMTIGELNEIKSETLLFQLLHLNTEILPVSIGIDTSVNKEGVLVLVESREIENLDDNELLSVFEALEIASTKIEILLKKHF